MSLSDFSIFIIAWLTCSTISPGDPHPSNEELLQTWSSRLHVLLKLRLGDLGAGSTYELMILSEAGVSGELHNKVFAPSICNHFGEGPAAQISGRIKE